MLSDEERKAIADLIDSSNLSLLGDGTCINSNKIIATILNLIEKQQKEIEELKEDRKKYAEEYIHNNPWLYKQLNENYILRTEANKLYNKKWEDKIKAKTIEIKNRPVKDEFITASQGKLNAIIDMESLLEKE